MTYWSEEECRNFELGNFPSSSFETSYYVTKLLLVGKENQESYRFSHQKKFNSELQQNVDFPWFSRLPTHCIFAFFSQG